MEKKPFTIAMILLLSLGTLAALKTNVAQAAPFVTLSDSELATQFARIEGDPVVITDVVGPGVRFDVTGAKTGVGDDYPVSQLAGGASEPHGYGDFSAYEAYRLRFTNVGTSSVTINLYMHTGYTTLPGRDWHWDTYWECAWVTVGVGESKIVTLDFSGAIVWNGDDDPVYGPYPGGTPGIAIWRLNEVSNIGFQVLGSGSVVVSDDTTRLYVDPPISTKTYGVDSFFDVFVTIEGVNDLFGVDIDIRWDNALMTYKEEDYTTYLNAMWGVLSWQVTKHEDGVVAGEGYYKFVAVCTHTPPGFSTSGNQIIFRLGFNVIDPLTNSKKTGSIHFATDKLSDSNSQPISHTSDDGVYEVWGMAVTIDMTHAGGHSRTCSKTHDTEHGNELFTLTMAIAEARNLAGVEFEIHFDTSMLNCESYSIVWGDTGSSVTIDETGGKVTGYLVGSGSPTTLVTLTFRPDPAYSRFWKDSALQPVHDDTNPAGIHFESVTLHYTGLSDLTWTSGGGGGGRITIPFENFAYTFSPIKGDLTLDGSVDVSDLGWEAGFYDTTNPDMNLVGADTIDIFDLVIIASNFWYHY
jgi:hypothetical protein